MHILILNQRNLFLSLNHFSNVLLAFKVFTLLKFTKSIDPRASLPRKLDEIQSSGLKVHLKWSAIKLNITLKTKSNRTDLCSLASLHLKYIWNEAHQNLKINRTGIEVHNKSRTKALKKVFKSKSNRLDLKHTACQLQ